MRKLIFCIEEFYHVYNRGVDKRKIFIDHGDHIRFLTLLYLCNSVEPVDLGNLIREGPAFTDLLEIHRDETLVDIGAYCLMPNHFHILIREKVDGGISKFMGKLGTGYSMYFNKKYKRSGALFEGRFKATHADTDGYLKYLFSYIHLNPIKLIDKNWKKNGISNKNEAKKYLAEYKYSSYLDYLGKNRPENSILNSRAFPEYFEDIKDFKTSTEEWLSFSQD